VNTLYSESNIMTNNVAASNCLMTNSFEVVPFDPKNSNMLIASVIGSPSIGSGSTIRVGSPERIEQQSDPGFGTHLREAVEIVKDWIGK
jgi:hypothetical protein